MNDINLDKLELEQLISAGLNSNEQERVSGLLDKVANAEPSLSLRQRILDIPLSSERKRVRSGFALPAIQVLAPSLALLVFAILVPRHQENFAPNFNNDSALSIESDIADDDLINVVDPEYSSSALFDVFDEDLSLIEDSI